MILDDNRTQTTDTTGRLRFSQWSRRGYACVTVKKTGYLTKTQCRQVESGEVTYNSVAMWEGTDPPERGRR